MRRKSSYLYDIIQALTEEEHEAIRLKVENSAALKQLLDLIRMNRLRDEKSLKAFCHNEPWFSQLPKYKHRLTDQIRSHLFPEFGSSFRKIMHEVAYLESKGLHTHAISLYEEAESLAMQAFSPADLLELVRYRESQLTYCSDDQTFSSAYESVNRIRVLAESESLAERFLSWATVRAQKAMLLEVSSARIKIQEILDEEELQRTMFRFPSVQLALHRTRFMLARRLGCWDVCIQEAEDFLKVFNESPDLLSSPVLFRDYHHAIFQLGLIYTMRSDFDRAMELLMTLRSLSTSTSNLQCWGQALTLHLNLAHEQSELQDIQNITGEFDAHVRRGFGMPALKEQVHIYYSAAKAFFKFGMFDKTIHWAHKNIREDQIAISPLQCLVSRMFFLISHLELENYITVKKDIAILVKTFSKYNTITQVEQTIIDHISGLCDSKGVAEIDDWKRVLIKIEGFEQNIQLRVRSKAVPYKKWILSKILSVPLTNLFLDNSGSDVFN